MKLAVAGKGGVGKTTLTVLLGEYLTRRGQEVWLVDADSSPCLGPALGLSPGEIPTPLVDDTDLIRERVGGDGMIRLTPEVGDLPGRLQAKAAGMTLLVMGSVAGAGTGCACAANALVKALLGHLLEERRQWVLVDLEAGVEHLGRGTAESVDGLVVVSEPSLRGLETAANVSRLARDLGLTRQVLVLNRAAPDDEFPAWSDLPPLAAALPRLASLEARQMASASALGLAEREQIDKACGAILSALANGRGVLEP
jgi:CO dehydrogenase maturation factor